jgi:hypothetical protein
MGVMAFYAQIVSALLVNSTAMMDSFLIDLVQHILMTGRALFQPEESAQGLVNINDIRMPYFFIDI